MTRFSSAHAIAEAIRSGKKSAVSIIQETLNTLRTQDHGIQSVTHLFADEALLQAQKIDAMRQAGQTLPPLAGVPFGVKDLFDIAGHVTTAGSVVLRNMPPAQKDAAIVQRLKVAGAIPVATLNMDEFAYGFATVNAHYGTTHNPHDLARMAGGSSGGSAAAVAAGFLPFALGSDTNGSIRIPASLCGVWGIKPTFGRLPRAGAYPFSASLDVVGSFASSLDDLITTFYVMDGSTPAPEPAADTLRISRLGGWFASNLAPALVAALDRVCASLQTTSTVELPEVASARAASFLITAAEGGNLHLPRLCKQAAEYDPATRDRLIAGALLPSSTYLQAQRFRNWFREKIHELFQKTDVLIAPAVMGEAPLLDQPTVMVDGKPVSARANLGLFTQPLSLPGLPVLCLPLKNTGSLPLGLQLVAAPGQEAALFSVARALKKSGLAGCVSLPEKEMA
ncbi:AtzE family amidohydrolase [Acetobacter oryzoeni]|uniref:AtzE family amidohydrolase n=1 Tax=Acetobacter oryzoeni TaxID=2500548 RepID=A0A5B9GGH9_9PROT|nr:AtzE family amidohydrolase [Acetobacter oryzoeni]MCP1201155.1 AtzE family amidohydrolase [Acetobacter oryzoeni]QEE85311.1 AtzE family amidohydrolase [Acetobacter oryzoeni]